MDKAIIVRHMFKSDLNFAAECTANQGWTTESRAEFEGFLAHDPNGCLVAEAGVEEPEHLLESLALEAEGVAVGVGVLETNIAAMQILMSCGLVERPDCPWRMVLGSEGHVGTSNQLHAIGSAAKG